MHYIAFGDVHESTAVLGSISDLTDAAGVIITGDITNRGTATMAAKVIDAVAGYNPSIFAQPGNMDTDSVQSYLKDKDMDIHLRVRELAPGIGLLGVGLSTITPFGTPGEVSEETLSQWLDETYRLAAGFDKLICVIHEPPHGTALDQIGNGQHVGSLGVRAFIERVQPALVICGHIHESIGEDTIGQTPVINPGMLSGGGYVRIDIAGLKIDATLKRLA